VTSRRPGSRGRGTVQPLKIENKRYASVEDQRLFITPGLKADLEKRKRRDGSTAYEGLTRMGFRGGKHLIEQVRAELGKRCEIVLSDQPSTVEGKNRVVINFDAFRAAGQQTFFAVYRETGLRTATQFLNESFPTTFTKTVGDELPAKKQISQILDRLPEAADTVSKKERAKLPARITELIERQGPDFVFELLSSVDAAIPKGQERIQVAFREVVARLAQEPAKALQELTDLMGELNLMQMTSLVSVLRSRLNTIETFETLVVDDKTYELRTDKSIHRTLERSMWLLDDAYWIAQSNKTLRTLIGKQLEKEDAAYASKRPDFACVDTAGRTVIVEIKRPSLELTKTEMDQAELYFRIIRKHSGDSRTKPVIFLVGNKISPEARELAEMRGYPKLLTYQEMVKVARQRYQEYLRIVEADEG
jgi:hypothetical protein